MRTIASQVNQEASQFGVQIVDVRIKRVDLPEANMQAIYRRMQTERQRQAAEFRAEGEGAARRIRRHGRPPGHGDQDPLGVAVTADAPLPPLIADTGGFRSFAYDDTRVLASPQSCWRAGYIE
jgi:hypothetical protein